MPKIKRTDRRKRYANRNLPAQAGKKAETACAGGADANHGADRPYFADQAAPIPYRASIQVSSGGFLLYPHSTAARKKELMCKNRIYRFNNEDGLLFLTGTYRYRCKE